MTRETENDVAWAKYFSQVDVLGSIAKNGSSLVRADDLKRITGREPRLLAKQDTLSSVPRVFRDNGLTIFPTRNGEYIIFSDPECKTYFRLNESAYPSTIETYRPRLELRTFDSFPGMQKLNESQALDFAFASSLVRHVTGDPGLSLVIRGRTYSGSFGFALPESGEEIAVRGVQIEVDGGYESRDAIVLIEAKVGRRSDFNMRQVFYPYLEWSSRSSKRIIPLFLVVTNGLFYFFEIRFGNRFGDLAIEHARCFAIDESPVTQIELGAALSRVHVEAEPLGIPFPQADDLDKVVDLVSMLEADSADKHEISEHFEFDERQGDYYGNAAAYLDLARRGDKRFEITEFGHRFISDAKRADRTSGLIDQMLRRPVFRKVIRLLLSRNVQIASITRSDIMSVIGHQTNLGMETISRRATTVLSWLRWIDRNVTLVE